MLSAALRRSLASAGMIALRVTLSTVLPPASSAAKAKISTDRRLAGRERERRQAGRRQRDRDLGCEHQVATLEAVGGGAAEQRKHDDRDQLDDPEQPDERRRARERVDLVRDRDERGLRSRGR